MNEHDMRDAVLDQLIEKYGEERVTIEPRLGDETTVYPDFAIFKKDGSSQPFLIVECSSFRTPHRQRRDFEKVTEAVEATDTDYAALVSSDVKFVFSGSGPVFNTLPDFPPLNQEVHCNPRPIQSQIELNFLITRALAAQKSLRSFPEREDATMDMLLEALHLLLQARLESGNLDTVDDLETIHDLQEGIEDRHGTFRNHGELIRGPFRAVCSIFRGYDLKATDEGILESLFELTSGYSDSGDYSTPLSVARQMVQLNGVEEGATVLDPAAGRGTILSLAAAEGGHGVGLDINDSIVSLSTFFTDLLDRDVEIFVGDFLTENENDPNLPDQIEHIIVDPPFNAQPEDVSVPYAEDRRVYSQDAFLAKGLSTLSKGGRLTISVPAGFLDNMRSRWIRQVVLEEYQLESVIQVISGPLYQNTQIDTALITVSKNSAPADHMVEYVIIDSPDEPELALKKAVADINNDDAESILQSELDDRLNFYRIVGQESALEKLETKFGEVEKLESVAEIRRGNRPTDVIETKEEDTIQYLSPSDLHDSGPRRGTRYLPEDEAQTIADEHCVLLSTLGQRNIVHIPNGPVAPAQHWAVIRFDTSDAALVYKAFLESNLGQEQLDALKGGSSMRRVHVGDLRDLFVPRFIGDEISAKAAKIRERDRQIENLEQKQEEIRRERERISNDPFDLSTGGKDDE